MATVFAVINSDGSTLSYFRAVPAIEPEFRNLDRVNEYTHVWKIERVVQNMVGPGWQVISGVAPWFAGKGHREGPKQIVIWYGNKEMWSGFSSTFAGAVQGAIKDAWRYI